MCLIFLRLYGFFLSLYLSWKVSLSSFLTSFSLSPYTYLSIGSILTQQFRINLHLFIEVKELKQQQQEQLAMTKDEKRTEIFDFE